MILERTTRSWTRRELVWSLLQIFLLGFAVGLGVYAAFSAPALPPPLPLRVAVGIAGLGPAYIGETNHLEFLGAGDGHMIVRWTTANGTQELDLVDPAHVVEVIGAQKP